MSALLAVSAISMVSCDGEKPTAGTYNYSGITRSDGSITIDKNDNVYFDYVWFEDGYVTGPVDVENVRVYDNGAYYWAAEVYCHTMMNVDPDFTRYQNAFASKNGKTITIALAAYKK